jgi:DMSO reductase family type II enzyme molybdopterin subunit
MTDQNNSSVTRRLFLKSTGAAALVAGGGLPLLHFKLAEAASTPAGEGKLASWDDLYRQRWTWDKVAKGSHGWANCRSACEWDLYVKDGIIVREEQTATYEQSEEGVPDFNPRGCQKGACYTEVMYGPSRLTVPMKRSGPRGSGKWQKISWEQAIDEIAEKMIDVATVHGTDTIYQDLGPNFDNGPTTVGRFKFLFMSGGVFADNWAEIGDLNVGSTLTMGFAHTGGSADEWFLSDYLVVWMMNPSVTQIPDAHFLYEAKYNGSELVVIDPQYSATTIHADQWLPIETGTDAALGLAVARHIIDAGKVDEAYVREQTDLPLLVRLDTGRFLREQDLKEGGAEATLYLWHPEKNAPVVAAGCQGAEKYMLTLDFEPPIEGRFEVKLKDGETVHVATVGSILKEHLDPYTFEEVSRVTGLSVEQIRQFAEGFANAERPMVLSSWGSNRFLHSDLMNRSKLLCLMLKGAIGKKGAGYQATGWVGLDGFGSELQVEYSGVRGKIAMMMGLMSAGDLWDMTVDIIRKKKTQEQVTREGETKYEEEVLCGTNVTSINWHYQGIKEDLNRELSKDYPRSLEDYFMEAEEKGWDPALPRHGSPKIFFTGGSNLLRRNNLPQHLLENMWSKMELIVDINPKQSFTGMHADYLLPAAGWYEKSGIKYAMSYVPYIHYCDAAVPPVGESKDEFEIHWLLCEAIQKKAIARNLPEFDGCGKRPTDWKTLHTRYSNHGDLGAKDAEKLCDQILQASKAADGMSVKGLKETGIAKYTSTGDNVGPVHLYNPDWKGEGVLNTLTQFTEHKDRWPTYSGRLTSYIDHPWFIEAQEIFATHKSSPKAGGDYPYQMVSCHSRWSIHSSWRDTPLLLRMQRGEPVMYLNRHDAEKLAIKDGEYGEFYNDYYTMHMRVKYSTMVRPGVAFYFHAWEPHQFPDHKSFKWLIPGLIKPLHVAGGYGQINHGLNKYQPGTAVQDTRCGIRAIDQSKVEELMASYKEQASPTSKTSA